MAVLDLEKLNSLDPAKDAHVIGTMVADAYKGSHGYLQSLARIWDENVNFFIGNQHLYYDESCHLYRERPVTKYNKDIPRPKTNFILPGVQTIASLFTRNRSTITNSPNSTDPTDLSLSKLVERICDAKWEIDEEDLMHVRAHMIALLMGTVFRKDYWDASAGPYSQELNGPIGDNKVEILTPLQVIPDIHSESYFIEAAVKPLFWIRANFSQEAHGFSGKAAEVKADSDFSSLFDVQQRLSMTIGRGSWSGSNKEDYKNSAVVLTAYIAPTEKHPMGLTVVVAGGQTLYCDTTKFYDPLASNSWHPYTIFKWQEHPLRWHGISLVENAVPLQRRLNAIDALIILHRLTNLHGHWFIPKQSGLLPGQINGGPGQYLINTAEGMPQHVSGIPLGGEVYKEREMVVQDLHKIFGDMEVLAGGRPAGTSTAAQQQMMIEQAYSKFSTPTLLWEKFIERGQTKKLKIIQKFYKEPRMDFINRLKVMNRDNQDVQIFVFRGADLRDNINIRVEAGSSLPKSKFAQIELYKELAQTGLFGPLDPAQNPVGNEEFLEKLGVAPIKSDLNPDVEKARWIVTVLTAISRNEMSPEMIPEFYEFDNFPLIEKMVMDRMKAPTFQDPNQVFKGFLNQLREFQAKLQAQQQPPIDTQALPASEATSPELPSPLIGSQSDSGDFLEGMPAGQIPLQ